MNTKEICSQLSVTPKMLRIYEKNHMIHPKREANNYRNYSLDDILHIQIIVTLKELGFSLKEIKSILDFSETENDYLYHFYLQLKAVEAKISELTIIKKRLSKTINTFLNVQDKNEINKSTLYASFKNDQDATIYEKMVNRWNFDQMAPDYINRFHSKDEAYMNTLHSLSRILMKMPAGQSFLDVGGGICHLWVDFHRNTNLTVLENSLKMILIGKDNVPWAKFILEDIVTVDKSKLQAFDVVVSSFTLHHIAYENQGKAIRNMLELTKDHGSILIFDRSYRNEKEKELFEQKLAAEGNFEKLDIIQSESYLIQENITPFIHYLGYEIKTLSFENHIWGFLIQK